jgi:CspA family cold shock protein
MEEGIVRWFDPAKGYGFIERKGGADLFVHYSSIAGEGYRTLVKGDKVQFEIEKGSHGDTAVNVCRI